MTTGRSVGGARGGLVWVFGAGHVVLAWYWVCVVGHVGLLGGSWVAVMVRAVGVGATEDRVALARPQTRSS